MSEPFYRITTAVSRKTGPWFFRLSSWFVAAGYYVLFPRRVAESVRFYRTLFPDRSEQYARRCAWRQYQNFTSVFMDRFLLQNTGELAYTSRGWRYLEEAIDRNTGGIMLMSHVGNWEVAAHLLKQRRSDIPLLLYMGIRHKEQIERMQKESLAESGIRIIAADPAAASPFDIIEGINFLKSGGLVSLTGDVVWHPEQRTVPAKFLGHEIHLPEMPYVLALLSGAPLFILFTFRTGANAYAFSVTEPIPVKAADRSQRQAVIRQAAQTYADHLEEAVRQHPLEWYHFRPFLGKRLHHPDSGGQNSR